MIEEPHWWTRRSYLYVGRMTFDKGVDTILRAWLEVYGKHPEKCPPLWLVGGTPSEIDDLRNSSSLAGEIRKHESAMRVHWWGYLDAPGISTLLLRSLVMIMHSRYEPGGRIVLEAMSEGVPVIATPHGFAKDLVVDWKNGFMVRFGDQSTLAHRMEHFLHQPLLRNSLGAAAREVALHSLSAWSFLDAHCHVYDIAMEKENSDLSMANTRRSETKYPHYSRRRFIPTYPYDGEEPSKERVINFVEENTGCHIDNIASDERAIGSSQRWIIASGSDLWVVKWPFSRLATRPLWDPDRRVPLVRDIRSRFASELFSSSLPGFASFEGEDHTDCLLLRRLLRPLKRHLRPEQFQHATSPLRKLYGHPLCDHLDFFQDIDRDWSKATMEDVQSALADVRFRLLECPEPWNCHRHVSLRLAWRQMELNIHSKRVNVPRNWVRKTQSSRKRFINIAQLEETLPIVICHGSGDLDHCRLSTDGSVNLIDGENIHPGWPGEDLAAMVACAIDDVSPIQNEHEVWFQTLHAITKDDAERATVLSWAAFLTLEDICRNNVLLEPAMVSHYQQRWVELERVMTELQY